MKLIFNTLLTFTVLSSFFVEDSLAKVNSKDIHKGGKKHHSPHKVGHVKGTSGITRGFSLAAAMHKAQETHPEIFGYEAAKEAATYRIDQAKGLRLPTVDVRAGVGKEYLRQKFSSNKLNAVPLEGSVNDNRFDPSISVRQPIFDGFDSGNKIYKAKLETEQADLKKAESMELTAFKAADHYIAVRRFKRLIDLAEGNVKKIKEIMGYIEQQISAGKATIVDREIATARLEDALAAVRDIEGDYHTAIAHFIDIVGVEPENLMNPEIERSLMPSSVEEGLKIAVENNRSLILAKTTKDVAKADVEISKTNMYPKIGLEIDAAKRHHVSGKPGAEDNVTALVVARFNVFNGGQDVARTKEARAKALQAHYVMIREKRNSEREVRISVGERESAFRQMQALREAVKAKKIVAESYKEQFTQGRRSFLDILEATYEHFLAQGSKISAEASYDLSCVRYLAAIGQLSKLVLNKTLPQYQVQGDYENEDTQNPDTLS